MRPLLLKILTNLFLNSAVAGRVKKKGKSKCKNLNITRRKGAFSLFKCFRLMKYAKIAGLSDKLDLQNDVGNKDLTIIKCFNL